MPLDAAAQHAEAERAELRRAVEALARWPRLSHLLQYMGEKVFSGQVDQINEYNIATEVLGRSKTVFNAAEDAIARVETHRLRKRLSTFYETEGRDHPIQITLPAGSYVPVFLHRAAGDPWLTAPDLAPKLETESPGNADRLARRLIPGWKVAASAAAVVLAASGVYLYLHTRGSSTRESSVSKLTPALVPPASEPEATGSAIRIMAGYLGQPRTDSAGRVWNPDHYVAGGGGWQREPGITARTSDQFLFEHSRNGEFTYSIPLKPGFYELHLLLSTEARPTESSPFNIYINGRPLLVGFDINVDALGEEIADERVFRDVSPEKDGFLRIMFMGAPGTPSLNAIEVLPGIPHAQLPVRIIMQTTPMTDPGGRFWHPDDYFMNGRLAPQARPLLDSPDPDLFSEERFGHFTYAIPVDTRDKYTVILHFVEFYFGPSALGGGGEGNRLFKVMCNGQTLLDNFDVFKEAGSLHEIAKAFHHLKPTAQGKLNLTFEPIVNNATVSGIEVLDEAQ
jgi:hypothetical protein